MTVYFCLDHLLDVLLTDAGETVDLDRFVPVQTTVPACNSHTGDALALASHPNLLQMNEPKGAHQLAALIEDVPLYHINLELLVDEILSVRHANQLVDDAVIKAFGEHPVPKTINKDRPVTDDRQAGALRHPMLGHLDKTTLAKIYLNFMRALTHGHALFSFERHVLGHQPGPFRARFDGFILGTTGQIRASVLLGFSIRSDCDPRRPLEDYVEAGRRKAAAMQITELHELVWAWLEADHYQLRRCYDIDRVLTLKGLPRMPGWIHGDIFHCLEKEAIKHALAERAVTYGTLATLLQGSPNIRKAIEAAATGNVDDNLQQLLAQTLIADAQYSRAAGRFHTRAVDRLRESQALWQKPR